MIVFETRKTFFENSKAKKSFYLKKVKKIIK